MNTLVNVLINKDNISFDSFTTLALDEKMSEDYLLQRAKRGQRERFLAVLNLAPDIEPIEEDKIL